MEADDPAPAPAITPEAARAALDTERAARLDACRRELAELLARHRCVLDVSVLLRQGQVIPQLAVVPASEE
jgi:hypothetical protein